MSVTPHLTYVVLRCADLELSRSFYAALGLVLVEEQHGTGGKHYSCSAGSVLLELYPLEARQTAGARLGFQVEDVEAAVSAARQAGGVVVRTDPSGTVLRDPDGHQIHLTSRTRESD